MSQIVKTENQTIELSLIWRLLRALMAFALVGGLTFAGSHLELPANAADSFDPGAYDNSAASARKAYLEQLPKNNSVEDRDLDDYQLTAKRKLLADNPELRPEGDNYGLTRSLIDETPIRVIIEMKAAPAIDFAPNPDGTQTTLDQINQSEDAVIDAQQPVKSEIEKFTHQRSSRSFGYSLNGFSIDCTPVQIRDLVGRDDVKSVYVSKTYQPLDLDANQTSQIDQVWQEHQLKGEGLVVSIIDTGIDVAHKDMRLTDPSTAALDKKQVDRLIWGTPQEPGLIRGQFYTDKVPFGYNYADRNYDVFPHDSPHGMHVSGIVAANGRDDEAMLPGEMVAPTVKGVAPEAQLLAMKVFGDDGNDASTEPILEAIDDSIKLGADVISMSLGSPGDLHQVDAETLAIQRAADKGILPVVAAGNFYLSLSNRVETQTMGAPAIYPESFSVGSVNNVYTTKYYDEFVDTDGQTLKGFEYQTWKCTQGATQEVKYDCDFDNFVDQIDASPAGPGYHGYKSADLNDLEIGFNGAFFKKNSQNQNVWDEDKIDHFTNLPYSELAFVPNYTGTCGSASGDCQSSNTRLAPHPFSFGLKEDFEKYVELNGEDSLKGKVVVVSYKGKTPQSQVSIPGNDFLSIQKAAAEFGAKGIYAISCDRLPEIIDPVGLRQSSVLPFVIAGPAHSLNYTFDPLYTLYRYYLAGQSDPLANFKIRSVVSKIPSAYGGTVSSFTSYGPTSTLDFKPEIAGIGGHVWSTGVDNSYFDNSGTSMATPFVSGSAALVLQNFKKNQTNVDGLTKLQLVKVALENTAAVVEDKDLSTPNAITPRRQGAGLVQVDDAINNQVYLTSAEKTGLFALREVRGDQVSFNATITNTSNESADYKFESPYGVQTEDNDRIKYWYEDDENGDEFLAGGESNDEHSDEFGRAIRHDRALPDSSIKTDVDQINIPAHSAKTIKITLTLPDSSTHADLKNNWIEGYFRLVSVDDSLAHGNLSAPFMGYWGNWAQADPVLDAQDDDLKHAFINSDSAGHFAYIVDQNDNSNISDAPFFSFSPDGDGEADLIKVKANVLRDLSSIDWSVRDSAGQIVKNLGRDLNVTLVGRWAGTGVTSPAWDGKLYNPQTQAFDRPIPEGEIYYIHADFHLALEGSDDSSYDWAVTADYTAPTVENFEVHLQLPFFVDHNMENACQIRGTISDNIGAKKAVGIYGAHNWHWIYLEPSDYTNNHDGKISDFKKSFDCSIIGKGHQNLKIAFADNAYTDGFADFEVQNGAGLYLDNPSIKLGADTGVYLTEDTQNGEITGSYTDKNGTRQAEVIYANSFDSINGDYLGSETVSVDEAGKFIVHAVINPSSQDSAAFTWLDKSLISEWTKAYQARLGEVSSVRINQSGFAFWIDDENLPDGGWYGNVYYSIPTKQSSQSLKFFESGATAMYLADYAHQQLLDLDNALPFNGWNQQDIDVENVPLEPGQNVFQVGLEQNLPAYFGFHTPYIAPNYSGTIVVNNLDAPDLAWLNISENDWNVFNADRFANETANGKFSVFGKTAPGVQNLIVDGQTPIFEADGSHFEVPVDLNAVDGIKRAWATWTDAQGQPRGTNLNFYVSTKFPELNFNSSSWETNGDGFDVYTDNSVFTLDGAVSTRLGVDRVLVNGERVSDAADTVLKDAPIDASDASATEHRFSRTYPLNTELDSSGEAISRFEVTAWDYYNNATTKVLHVHYSASPLAAPLVNSEDVVRDGVVQSVKLTGTAAPQATVQWSFDGEDWADFITSVEIVENRSTFWRAVDRFGNVSLAVEEHTNGVSNQMIADAQKAAADGHSLADALVAARGDELAESDSATLADAGDLAALLPTVQGPTLWQWFEGGIAVGFLLLLIGGVWVVRDMRNSRRRHSNN